MRSTTPICATHQLQADRLKEVLSYIHAHIQEPMKVEDIAQAANISRTECFRCFQIILQKTPQEYITGYRIALAGQIAACLGRMIEVGIGYLSLGRRTDTLSGGENQRLKIVRNLGSSLSNITYIFDEPTAGLHPADAEKIGNLLLELRDRHNNVLVVEHNPQILALADHIIELGPLAGTAGGHIIYEGLLAGLKKADTPTARSWKHHIEINSKPLPWREGFAIHDAHIHKLKHTYAI